MCSMFNSVHVRNHLFNLCPISIKVGDQSRSPSPFVRYRRRYTHEVYGTRSNMPNFLVRSATSELVFHSPPASECQLTRVRMLYHS